METDQITGIIVQTAMEIHRELGPGLLESVYELVLAKMLSDEGLMVEVQKPVNIEFRGYRFDHAFRCDLLVENRVVVELKSVETIHAAHQKQLLTYLRLMKLEVGLLINFGAPLLKEGLQRIVNHHRPSKTSKLEINHRP